MNVKGLKITDILDIDLDTFNNLNESQLRALTSRLVSASNKRIRRLEKHKINSPAMQQLGDNKKFSTKLPKNVSKQQRVNKLRSEFARARSFLTSETSTIGGYNKFKERTYERIHKETGIPKDVLGKIGNRLFDLLHKAQAQGLIPSYRGSAGSIHARNVIAEILVDNPNADENTIMTWLDEQMTEWYEDQEELEDEEDYEEFEW